MRTAGRWTAPTVATEMMLSSLAGRARVHVNHAHVWLYERSGGRLGPHIAGQGVLLLTTTCRTSARRRRTPVQYEVDVTTPG